MSVNYEYMSDFEINSLIASALEIKHYKPNDSYFNDKGCEKDDRILIADSIDVENCGSCNGFDLLDSADYCNNPSDMWPLIIESQLCHDWVARHMVKVTDAFNMVEVNAYVDEVSVLKVYAIAWLKLKEEEKGNE